MKVIKKFPKMNIHKILLDLSQKFIKLFQFRDYLNTSIYIVNLWMKGLKNFKRNQKIGKNNWKSKL